MAVLANYRSLSRQFFVFNYIPVAHRSAIGVPRGHGWVRLLFASICDWQAEGPHIRNKKGL